MNRFLVLFFIVLITACRSSEHDPNRLVLHRLHWPADSIAFDTARVASVIDLKTFRPERVVYQFKKEAATDSLKKLHAILYYDEPVFIKILEKYMDQDFPKGDYQKNDFEFDWLNDTIQAELQLSKPDYRGNPDIFLGTEHKGQLWFLNKKVLLSTELE